MAPSGPSSTSVMAAPRARPSSGGDQACPLLASRPPALDHAAAGLRTGPGNAVAPPVSRTLLQACPACGRTAVLPTIRTAGGVGEIDPTTTTPNRRPANRRADGRDREQGGDGDLMGFRTGNGLVLLVNGRCGRAVRVDGRIVECGREVLAVDAPSSAIRYSRADFCLPGNGTGYRSEGHHDYREQQRSGPGTLPSGTSSVERIVSRARPERPAVGLLLALPPGAPAGIRPPRDRRAGGRGLHLPDHPRRGRLAGCQPASRVALPGQERGGRTPGLVVHFSDDFLGSGFFASRRCTTSWLSLALRQARPAGERGHARAGRGPAPRHARARRLSAAARPADVATPAGRHPWSPRGCAAAAFNPW